MPRNPRAHDAANVKAIADSLRRFGQLKPIVVAEGNVVIAGNGTLEAARSIGWDTIQVVRTDLNGLEQIAFAIADNRTAELAEWNDELAYLMKELSEMDASHGLGFTDSEMETLMAPLFIPPAPPESATPGAPAKEVPGGNTSSLTLHLTPPQRDIVYRAIEKAKKDLEEPNLHMGACVSAICASWMEKS